MQTKLTLRMDDRVVAKAKKIARQRHQSVSKMVEEQVDRLDRPDHDGESTPELPIWIQKMKISPKKRRKGTKKSYDELKWDYLKAKHLEH